MAARDHSAGAFPEHYRKCNAWRSADYRERPSPDHQFQAAGKWTLPMPPSAGRVDAPSTQGSGVPPGNVAILVSIWKVSAPVKSGHFCWHWQQRSVKGLRVTTIGISWCHSYMNVAVAWFHWFAQRRTARVGCMIIVNNACQCTGTNFSFRLWNFACIVHYKFCNNAVQQTALFQQPGTLPTRANK